MILAAGLTWWPVHWLAFISLASLVAALIWAAERTRRLLHRTRWLFLSLAVLFVFATPGEYLPGLLGDIGLTHEGLRQALEHTARLLALLASLALVHQVLGNTGLVAGFHALLKPLPWRDATVVRLMLVLEYVEQRNVAGWKDWLAPGPAMPEGPQRITLPCHPFGWIDVAMLAVPLLIMVVHFWP